MCSTNCLCEVSQVWFRRTTVRLRLATKRTIPRGYGRMRVSIGKMSYTDIPMAHTIKNLVPATKVNSIVTLLTVCLRTRRKISLMLWSWMSQSRKSRRRIRKRWAVTALDLRSPKIVLTITSRKECESLSINCKGTNSIRTALIKSSHHHIILRVRRDMILGCITVATENQKDWHLLNHRSFSRATTGLCTMSQTSSLTTIQYIMITAKMDYRTNILERFLIKKVKASPQPEIRRDWLLDMVSDRCCQVFMYLWELQKNSQNKLGIQKVLTILPHFQHFLNITVPSKTTMCTEAQRPQSNLSAL